MERTDRPSVLARIRTHPVPAAAIAIAAAAAIAFGVYWFAPQRLVLDREVAEPPPTGPAASAPGPAETAARELAAGSFTGLEHGTTGRVRVVELGDGSRFVRLEDLDTSDGPDLRVLLTDRPFSKDWRVWDDGEYVDLGALKGNLGDSNYRIPDGLDLDGYRTVVIWCRRFTVGFGVAPIR